jgi:hypothetical protein
MKSRSDLNNRGIVLLQSNCIAGACQAFEEAARKTTDVSRSRRTTTEALPHRSVNSSSHVIDFATLENSVDAKALLLLMHQALIVLIRLPRECPFTAAVVPYNAAMSQLSLAATCVLNTIKAEECREEAKRWLDQSQQKLQKWCNILVRKCSIPQSTREKNMELAALLRTAVLLQLWVTVTLCRLCPSKERHEEIQQIQLFLLNHDQRQRLQQGVRIEASPISPSSTKAQAPSKTTA